MSKRIIPVALLSSLTLIAGVASAAETDYPADPERSFTTLGVPAAKTRAEVLMELADFRKNPVSADNWQYVGGEREWSLVPHRFDFVDGKLTHTDKFDHNAPKPSLSISEEEETPDRRTLQECGLSRCRPAGPDPMQGRRRTTGRARLRPRARHANRAPHAAQKRPPGAAGAPHLRHDPALPVRGAGAFFRQCRHASAAMPPKTISPARLASQMRAAVLPGPVNGCGAAAAAPGLGIAAEFEGSGALPLSISIEVRASFLVYRMLISSCFPAGRAPSSTER